MHPVHFLALELAGKDVFKTFSKIITNKFYHAQSSIDHGRIHFPSHSTTRIDYHRSSPCVIKTLSNKPVMGIINLSATG